LAEVQTTHFSTTKLTDLYEIEMLSRDWSTAFVFIDNILTGQ